jgi:hypothetical protein
VQLLKVLLFSFEVLRAPAAAAALLCAGAALRLPALRPSVLRC